MKYPASPITTGEDLSYNKEIVGKRLAEVRRSRRMSQLDAARALGVTQSSISQLETGRRKISSAMLIKLVKLYDANVGDILGLPSDRPVGERIPVGAAEALLLGLAENAGSEVIAQAVRSYVAVCIYRMFRELYECNPHNSGELFSISSGRAKELTKKLMLEEPARLRSMIDSGSKSRRSRLELPVEKGPELRRFIEDCERLLLGFRDDAPEK